MPGAPKICFDKILPLNLRRAQRTRSAPAGRLRAIAPKDSIWVNGSRIRIRFLDGDARQRDMVRSIAPEWANHANLQFEFTQDPNAEIRVTFNEDDGAWSYIGRDNLGIPKHAATLNLGWQDQAVILHEFGHMIGLAHEHSNPEGGIVWNEAAVIRDLSGPPNFWDEDTIRHNVLEKYSADQIRGTDFDRESIMLYAFPDDWTQNTGPTHENKVLSGQDKAFVGGASMYPGAAPPEKRAAELALGKPVKAEISRRGEEDLYQLHIDTKGVYTIETSGSTDVVLALYGPSSPTRLIGEDDDGGAGFNARLVEALSPGTYFVQVRHYNPDRTGAYKLAASRR